MGSKLTGQEKTLEQLAALPDEASRRKYLSRHRRLLSPSLVAQLDDAVSALLRKDLPKAQALAEAAVAIAQKARR